MDKVDLEIKAFIKGIEEALPGFKISYKMSKMVGNDYTILVESGFFRGSLHLSRDLIKEEQIPHYVADIRRRAINYGINFSDHAKITEERLYSLEKLGPLLRVTMGRVKKLEKEIEELKNTTSTVDYREKENGQRN